MFTKNRKLFIVRFILIFVLVMGMLGLWPIKSVLAATSWYVATTGDDMNDCATPSTPCATINGAIGKAIDNSGDTIKVAVGTYTGSGTEVVLIDKSVTLSGGWDATFSTQNGISTIDGQAARRGVYKVGYNVIMGHFLITNGYTSGAGGGIYQENGTLTLNNSTVSENTANTTGGISNIGTLMLNNSIVSNNTASSGGGGISSVINNLSTLTLNNSIVSGNTGQAGGIFNQGTLTLYNSTISSNTASADLDLGGGLGGGIYNYGGTATVYNSTVSENTSTNFGGGIFSDSSVGGLTLNNSTVSNNSAAQMGGGIYYYGSNGTIQNSILAGNITGFSGPDCYAASGSPLGSLGYNLIGNNSGCTFTATTGDQVGSDVNPINPFLNPLQDNGGNTFTHALAVNSPAIDAGNPATCLSTDQRGVPRPQGGNCDIGAYEKVVHYVKWDAISAEDGTSWADAYTDLQSALSAASSGDEIWVAAGTYKPTSDSDRTVSFELKDGVAIYGGFVGNETLRTQRDPATNVTVLSGDIGVTGASNSGDNSYHVVVGSNTNNSAILDGFTVTAGNANGGSLSSGGGMWNDSGSPTLTNLIFNANSAVQHGGGMYNESSNPTLTNTIFSANSAGDAGGGMANAFSSPMLTNVIFNANFADDAGGGMANAFSSPILTNVTFSANSADHYGGGMANATSNPTLINVTFSANSAVDFGGGMANAESSSPALTNTLIAHSLSGGDCVNDTSTLHVSSSNNLIEDTGANACGLTNSANDNIIGQDPKLDALADNGGLTQTHALLVDSPAIDAGNDADCPYTDQRGVTRPQGSQCDIGAYEYVTPVATFEDVPTSHPFWRHIEAYYNSGITVGCSQSPKLYCPDNRVTRGEMAVFIERAMGNFSPTPSPTGMFSDLPYPGLESFTPFIEEYYNDGITVGCLQSPLTYCPQNNVTRGEMAVFIERAIGNFSPSPSPTGMFSDVPYPGLESFTPFIEEFYNDGITVGCVQSPLMYCPQNYVTRGEMAVFIVRAFGIPLP